MDFRASIITFFSTFLLLLFPLMANAQDERTDWLDIEVGKSVV